MGTLVHIQTKIGEAAHGSGGLCTINRVSNVGPLKTSLNWVTKVGKSCGQYVSCNKAIATSCLNRMDTKLIEQKMKQ